MTFLEQLSPDLTPKMVAHIGTASLETLYMGLASTAIAVLIGLPLGFWAFLSGKGRMLQNRMAFVILDALINIGRSVPFIILLIVLMPFTRFVVGSTLGTKGAIVPLAVAAIPFFARLTANALAEIPTGLTEAAKSMGASHWQVIVKYYLPESMPILINAATLTLVSLIGYSAMAGVVGGGGLGSVAINYGEHRGMEVVKWVSTIIIVAIVMALQWCGDKLAQKFDHR